MASTNRSSLLTKSHRVLKRHYKPVAPNPERPLLEQLLFAACLENAHYASAEEAMTAVRNGFFDWNEIRVSTVKELADVMPMLPNALEAASRLKRILQSVFESNYAFELEGMKKLALGQAIKRLKKLDGTTYFSVCFVTQACLGGHAIPLDQGALLSLEILRLVDDPNPAEPVVPGLERAISKSKGIEFGSLLHQLGADLVANPYSPATHKILLDISPDAKSRLPKRPSKKQLVVAKSEAAGEKSSKHAARAEKPKKPTATASEPRSEPPRPRVVQPKRPPAAAKRKSLTDRKKSSATKRRSGENISRRKPR